jgi:membrane-bound lytic murein transglycosylase B
LGHGLEFWRENATALTRAERQFGVPAEVIAAIIGVETIYGRNTGNFRIIDVLLTLAFVDGRRPDLYRDELEAFLLWTRESGVDPLEPRGSYAGAIGLPQFMPSSIRRWAVDFDGSGRLDLRASTVDAIGSVANFLAGHGWQTGAGATWEARLSATADLEVLTKEGIEPKFTSAQLTAQGVVGKHALDRLLNDPLRKTGLQGGETFGLHATGTARMAAIELLGWLVATDPDLVGVDDNDEVTRVEMGGVGGLVLATQHLGHLAGQPAEGLIRRVDQIPLAVERVGRRQGCLVHCA